MKRLIILILLLPIILSCNKTQDRPSGSFLTGDGVFIINEGNFTGGNGSLSFYSYDSSKIYNDLFEKVNGRPLGDVPNSMELKSDLAYIIVNNSGKIEVIKKSTLESVSTITGIISPRNIAFASDSKAYLTSMYSDSLVIINLADNSVSGYINLRRSSESIVIYGSKAFVSEWVGGSEVMVINIAADEVEDSITVGNEPESMVLDKAGMLWVLCNGGWARDNFAELDQINTSTNEVVQRMVFPTKQASPSCLSINGSGDTLYYLETGVRRLNISASDLPAGPLIPESGHYFYKLGINPVNGDIFVTDAIDYQQNGYVLYYKSDGTFIKSLNASVIPGSMCFKTAGK
jgi:DNA-binding beta-propeller fold protein YncE